MSQKLSPIICDGCGKDITTTGNCQDYRLRLTTFSPMPWYAAEGRDSGALTLMAVYPAIKNDLHFCNSLRCVKSWVEKLKLE